MNTKALYKLTYGVYLLTAREVGKDNGCIIHTAVQVANRPTRISIAVIQGNLTHDMIARTGVFNLSAITTEAEFSLFQRFGMQSGRSVDKFADFPDAARSENGLYYLTKWANAFLSLKVVASHDLGSHTLFIGEVVDGEVLSSVSACSYGYYQSDIKTKRRSLRQRKAGSARSVGTSTREKRFRRIISAPSAGTERRTLKRFLPNLQRQESGFVQFAVTCTRERLRLHSAPSAVFPPRSSRK